MKARMLALVALTVFSISCTPEAIATLSAELTANSESTLTAPAAEVVRTLTEETLRNGIYSGIYDEPVQLVDGQYEGPPLVEGSALRPTIWFAGQDTAFGDIDGDGVAEVVVHLTENSGGSGFFSYLILVDDQAGDWIQSPPVLIGDRIVLHALSIEQDRIWVEMTTQGPGDPFCCPSQRVRFALQPDGSGMLTKSDFVIVQPSISERLKNATYHLADIDEPVVLVDGQFEGQPFVEGAASRPTATLQDLEGGSLAGIAYARGDLSGDAQLEVVVILSVNLGGSGGFRHLVVLTLPDDGSAPIQLAATMLGDRIKVNSLYLAIEEIVLDVITHGPNDGLCCPTQKAEWRFKLDGDQLVRTN